MAYGSYYLVSQCKLLRDHSYGVQKVLADVEAWKKKKEKERKAYKEGNNIRGGGAVAKIMMEEVKPEGETMGERHWQTNSKRDSGG